MTTTTMTILFGKGWQKHVADDSDDDDKEDDDYVEGVAHRHHPMK